MAVIKYKFQVPLYKVDVTLAQIEDKDDEKEAVSLCKAMGADKEDIEYLADGIRNGAVNGGDTYRQLAKKRMLVIFYPFDSERERTEVYSHEKRHVEDRILEYFGVHDIESAGILAGFLGEKFYYFNKIIEKK